MCGSIHKFRIFVAPESRQNNGLIVFTETRMFGKLLFDENDLSYLGLFDRQLCIIGVSTGTISIIYGDECRYSYMLNLCFQNPQN